MTQKKNWVDFKQLKQDITIEMVLSHYGLLDELNESGQNLTGCCPIHKGSNPRQFSVNLVKNIYNCFGNCKSGGNIFDFVSKMEKVPIREAALLIKNWFPDQVTDTAETSPRKRKKSKNKLARKEKKSTVRGKANKPLKFKLTLNGDHPFFEERSISSQTVKHFGLGLCEHGILKDRIAIPIHNHSGRAVAYCGRAVTKEQAEEAKYKMPSKRKFNKSLEIYNLHRLPDNPERLIIVESFISVWWLHQLGYTNVISLMGSSLSKEHEELILKVLGPSGMVILMFDNDESGWNCADDCLFRLSRQLFVKVADVSQYDIKKPHQLNPDQAKALLG